MKGRNERGKRKEGERKLNILDMDMKIAILFYSIVLCWVWIFERKGNRVWMEWNDL